MKYIAIDGDDIGRLITSCYLSEDEIRLKTLSSELNNLVNEIKLLLEKKGFDIIFCAADGITAKTQINMNYADIFNEIRSLSYEPFTFSVGVADTLKDAFISLMDAKCNGKNTIKIK